MDVPMLKPVVDFGKQVINLARDTQQNKEDIKALRQEMNTLHDEDKEMRP